MRCCVSCWPVGVPTDLTAANAATVLRGLRPVAGTGRVRKSVAKDLVADIKRYDIQLPTVLPR
ncbi:hypothetical protein GCM10011610_69660 [Nocardia rhizosphaerihabitans]|uniref:Uncharacterized protein n=1 Tax=Nocardia rhizosphaerihabitans TaxID=1691570 RepID=A0ABQ2L5E9_9NOCA|nr:hypothetical protein GCM10011610_69660 [Nocardia rhizosphaerihabitans]